MINYFFVWRDALEILFFANIFYYFMVWLSKDKQKNLLGTFYGYCVVAALAYILQLTAISSLLLLTAPLALVIFILFHQETLQRNFVSLKNITPAQQTELHDWIEILVRTALHALNKNRSLLYIIEQRDSLNGYLTTPFAIYAPLQRDLLIMLLDGHAFDETAMIWVTAQGQLIGINATWNTEAPATWLKQEVQELEPWCQNALWYTNKTDAIILHTDVATRTFTIVGQGKIIERLTAAQTLTIIKQYAIQAQHSYKAQGETNYGNQIKKSFAEQPNA